MNEGAVTVDGEGTILYSNTRFAILLKTPLEKVLGVPLPGFIALAERDRFRDFLKHSAQRNATLETTLLAADGSEYTVLISANPLTVSDLAGICIVVTDITDRKIMEKAQRDLAKNIIEAQENERQRVARELHDGVNQLLSSTKHRCTIWKIDLSASLVPCAVTSSKRDNWSNEPSRKFAPSREICGERAGRSRVAARHAGTRNGISHAQPHSCQFPAWRPGAVAAAAH
jgi:PAS domain S-box-containing protein